MSPLGRALGSCLLSVTLCAAAATKPAKPVPATRVPGADQVSATTLANGMKVIVWPDHDIPNVALYNWVRVGSRNEAPGITGLAHFFEHMMFNGTSKYARRASSTASWKRRAARNNAYTIRERHRLPGLVSAHRARAWCSISKSDRLANLAFDPKMIESERGVVYSERRLRVEDSNDGFARRAGAGHGVRRASLPDSRPSAGRRTSRAGRMEDLQKLLQDLLRAEQLHAGAGGRLSARRRASRWRRSISSPFPRQETAAAGAHDGARAAGREARALERSRADRRCLVAYKSPAAKDPRAPACNLLLLHPHRRRFVAPAPAAGGRKAAGHRRGRSIPRRFRSGPLLAAAHAARGRQGRRRWRTMLDDALAQVVAQGVTDAGARRAPRISTPRHSGSSSRPSTARPAC